MIDLSRFVSTYILFDDLSTFFPFLVGLTLIVHEKSMLDFYDVQIHIACCN